MKEYRNSIFSIRKLSIGVVSLCIGTGLFLSSLTGLQVEASERIATVDQEIRFHYLLEEELSPEEKSRIVQQLPKDLRKEATYFLVYRPQSPKVLPATGEVVSHAAAWLAAGFLVIAVQAIGSKKSRVVSLLYITLAGSALPPLQVDALQSHALAHFNQTVTVKTGDLLPDGKLELTSYDFVGYIVEDGKVDQTVSSEQAVEQVTKQPQILDSSHSNQTVLPEKAPVSEQVQTEETGLQLVTRYREEKIPLEIERLDVEDPNLALGETRLEAGQAGYRIQRYEEKWLGNQLQSSHLMETQEVVGKPEILYRGTKTTIVQEEISQVPSDSPQATPPVRLDFQLKERVDRQVLSIPEERIETDRLAQGETEVEEGREGLLEITYQDVVVAGQVIASNELHRQETSPISRKVYVGTREKEEVPEPPIETLIPSDSPQATPPVRLDFQLKERVDRQVLSIPEERIETDRLAQGETEVEEGREGLLEITYQDVVVAGQVIASNELHRQETSPISRKVYVGTREKEEVPEPPIETLIPSDSPQATPPVRLDFQLKERVDRQVLSIPEERIETERLAQGETEVEEGREGLLEITYQDVVVAGQVIASNELHRQETSPISRKVYVGTRVDSKGVAPLTHSLPSATLISEEVAIPFDRIESEDPDMAQGTSRVEPGQDGLALVTYADLNGVRTLLTSEEIKPAKSEVTYRGSRVEEVVEEEIPLVERIIELADQYTDYIWVEQAGYPGRRRRISHNGQVISEEVEPGQERIIHKGIKPIEGSLVEEESRTIAFSTIYQADPELEFGRREEFEGQLGQEVIAITYRTIKGQKTEELGRERIEYTPPVNKLIRVGTKATIETVRESLPVHYQADTSLPITSEPVRQEGRDRVTTITTTYTLNSSTGEVTANEPVREVTDEGAATIVRVGAQPTIREESQSLPTIYRAREDKEPPYREEVVSGQARRVSYQTNYEVDSQTGVRTPQAEVQTVLDQGRAAEVEVGTKATLVRENIQHRIIRQDDMDLPIGEEIAGPVGQDGSITRTTSYRLDERTGQLESLPVQVEETPAINQVIRVGKKVVEEPAKPLEKPSVSLETQSTGSALVVDGDNASVELHYRVADPDRTLLGLRLEVYHDDQLVKTIDHTHQGLDTDKIQVTDLEHYVPYQARLSFRYRTQDGQAEETVATLPFDISPKSIEFRDVTSRELYRLTRDNELERVTSLVERPSDLTNYIARYKTEHQREILLTVSSIEEADGHYKVKVHYPKLVQNRTSDANSLEESDYFTVEKVVLEPGAYTDFGALLKAIKANTSGTFKLAADLVAGDIQENTYIPQFSGKLESVSGKNYKILNLRKPLFGQLTNATIQNISLSEVNIEGGEQKTAALAQTMTGGKVENVRVDGRIQSSAGAAGLVHTASNANFRNVAFKGQLDASNLTDRNTTRSAGLVGDLRYGTVTNAYIDVDAVFSPRRSMMDQLGGLAGYSLFSQLNNVYLTGKIQQTEEGSVAGIAAGEYGSQASNVLTNLQLPATAAMAGLRTPLTIHATDQATGTTPATVTVQRISEDRISSLLEEWGMAGLLTSPSTGVSASQTTANQIDFSQLQAARPELVTAYRNMAKLLPFYDRHTIVRMGNRVEDTSPLNRSLIQSILPIYKGKPLQNLYVNKEKIEQLLLYFQDGSVETMDVEHLGSYENTGITEYRLGRDLLYTPDQWLLSAQLDSVLSQVTNEYQGLDVESEAYALKTKMAEFARSQGQQFDIRQLYLKSSQDQLKANLSSELGSLIDRQWISDLSNPAIQSYIAKQLTKEKESIWLGLTYLHRHYNIDFKNLNIQDLMKFRPDFYGQKISVLDWLKRVGSLEFEKLLTFYAPETYSKYLSDIVTTDKNLISFLEYNRQLFSPTQSNREWFESATKAFLYTDRTAETDGRSNHVYDHLKRFDRYHKYLLPILTIPEENELTVISTAHLLSFGGYGRYVDMKLAETQPQVFDAAVRRLEEQQIPKSAALWSQFVEFWKGVISESARTRLQDTSVLIWDGYLIKDAAGTIDLSEQKNDKRRWAAQFGDSYRVIDDFFGPVFKYYPYAERVSASAEMNLKQYIDFGNTDVLTSRGDSTLSHELIHLFEDIILDLHGKRRGQDSESYAMGLLQSVASSNAYYYGFNFMGDLPESSNHNSQAGRLQSATDLQEYMKGSFDTTYFLDAMEMQVMLGLDRPSQRKLLRKIRLVKGTPTVSNGVQYADSIDRISDLTDVEWDAIQLTNTDSFVDHQLMLANTIAGAKDYLRDNIYNYYFVPLFYPIYAGLLNDQGTVGGLQFRRTALELLAEKGWQEGFIPYASDALRGEAESMQKPLSDEYIWKKVMPDYDSYSHFKKERYRQMVEKQGHIKPVQIVWNNTTHQISSGQDIQVLMRAAIQEDLANPRTSFKRQQLKEVLYKAFHEASQEFRESIFLP
ncbi:TPA: G5 domain-containing protein [Streptococcus suis]|nr:G5 domain-containing protein [Streptococcus suis]